MYTEEDMLMLSGIQHYRYCPRQWALIHMEQQWADNVLTAEGQIMHKNVDNPYYRQKCGDIICLRSVSVASFSLGLYGLTDVVELHHSDSSANSITHARYPGYWHPIPVEYKHGRPKSNDVDELQLTAQAMCLEEMYGIRIEYGSFFYGQTRRRIDVDITDELRNTVSECSLKMHEIFESRITPPVNCKPSRCRKCSLANICMPEIADCIKASYYLKKNLYNEETA